MRTAAASSYRVQSHNLMNRALLGYIFSSSQEVSFLSSEKKKGKMTVEEAGKKGGEKTSQTHSKEFYEEIGHKGGEKGGTKGGHRVRELVKEGKEHEEE